MFANADTSGDGLVTMDEYLQAMNVIPPSVHG